MRQLVFSITSAARWPFTGSTTATPRPTSADLERKCNVDPFVAGVATPAGSAALTSPGGGALCAATVRLRHGVAYFLSARQSWRPNATQTQHAYMHDTRAQACMCTLGDREVPCRARHAADERTVRIYSFLSSVRTSTASCGGVARLAFSSSNRAKFAVLFVRGETARTTAARKAFTRFVWGRRALNL